MTTYNGNSGVVKVSTTTIAEVTKFSVTETMGTLDDTAQGDTARTHLSEGLQAWSGSIEGHYYPGDTGGQDQLVAGASLSLVLNAIGTTTGRQKLSGTVTITSIAINSGLAEVVSFTAAFTGNGAMSRGTN